MLAGTPPGCDLLLIVNRGYRSAQPPAIGCHPSGMKGGFILALFPQELILATCFHLHGMKSPLLKANRHNLKPCI
jgi:hypothetical protein